MVRSSEVEHKQVVNSARRPSSMENSARRLSIVNNSIRQSSSVDSSIRQQSRLHSMVRHADSPHEVVEHVDTLDTMVEHEANSVNLVERLHSSDKLVEHVKSLSNSEFEEEELLIQRLEIAKRDLQQSIEKEVRDNLIIQVSLERREHALQKRHLEFEEDVSSLQEQLQVKKDLRAVLEVQNEKWRLEMDEEIEHNNIWVWPDLSKGSRSIDNNSVNDKSATKTKNAMSNKSAKEKNKFANKDAKIERAENKLATGKAKYKSTIDKVKGKSVMKKAKNLTIHEKEKHNVRRVIAHWKP